MSGAVASSASGVGEELFGRQVVAAMRVATWANVANLVCVIVLAAYVALPGHPRFALTWVALAMPAATLRVIAWRLGERGTPGGSGLRLTRRYHRVSMIEVTVQGVLNTAFLGYLLPRIDVGRQIVLVASFAGVMGAGAIALSTVRSLGSWWAVIHVVGSAPTFLRMHTSAYDVVSGQVLVYGGVLVVGVVYLADSFERRTLAEIGARRTQQFVELLLDDFEDGSRDWLWETDSTGLLTHTSERLAEVSGHAVGDLSGRRLVDLLESLAAPSEEGRRAFAEFAEAIRGGTGLRDHVLPVRVDGSERWWTVSATPRSGPEGGVVGWRGVGADTTQAHRHAQELLRLARTDPLTGLANRRRLQEVLDASLDTGAALHAAGEDGPREVHLAIFDLDNFKAVNDTLGHSVGDELLVQVAARMSAHGEGTLLARLGGDEFAVVAQPPSRPDHPELLFAPFHAVFVEPFVIRGNRLQVTASVGCARAVSSETTADELVGMADLALYDAKAVSPGRMSSFSSSMSDRALRRTVLLSELDRAIRRREFVFHYQSQHDVVTGRVVATEALLRWEHPRRGLLMPAEFLTVAEDSGLLVSIGALMIREACRKLSTLGGTVRLAFNVSQVELAAPDFLDNLEQALTDFHVDPARLELEVTESAAATAQSESILREVRQLGVRIAVDDFGVGYSSLARLQQMPLDVLKIDRVFAAALSSSSRRSREVALAIMKSAVDIGSALGVQTVAEGIEDPAQLALLRRLGVDLAQGYFVATPTPDVTRHLRLVDPPA